MRSYPSDEATFGHLDVLRFNDHTCRLLYDLLKGQQRLEARRLLDPGTVPSSSFLLVIAAAWKNLAACFTKILLQLLAIQQ